MPEVIDYTHNLRKRRGYSEQALREEDAFGEGAAHIGFRCGNNPDLYALTVVPCEAMGGNWMTRDYLLPEAEISELGSELVRYLMGWNWSRTPCNVENPQVDIVYSGDIAPSVSEAIRALFRHEPDPWDITGQLEELKTLKAGWFDDDSQPYDSDILDQLARMFAAWYPKDFERPYIFPTPDGAVRAEWRWENKDVSLEIDLPEFTAYWHWIDLVTDESDYNELDLNNDESWQWVAKEIRQVGNKTPWTHTLSY